MIDVRLMSLYVLFHFLFLFLLHLDMDFCQQCYLLNSQQKAFSLESSFSSFFLIGSFIS